MSNKTSTVVQEQQVTPPVFPNQLINEPKQTIPAPNIEEMGPLKHLIGTWTNKNLGSTQTGGRENPYSYIIMPLPTKSADAGYILKNFKYYEEITFSPINGNAPNRGGDYTQNANVLFYEQRIYFAEGPAKDQLIHAENGSWLFLKTAPQAEGPYNSEPTVPYPGKIPTQPIQSNIAKQMSVPHGNSILVQGEIAGFPNNFIQDGPLVIPDYPAGQAIPKGVDTTPYTTQSIGNPFPELNNNPIQPLQDGVNDNPCTNYIQFGVDSKNQTTPGHITNIPFEEKKAEVIDYNASYWLQAFDNSKNFTQLSYIQTIILNLPIDGKIVKFPHPTCNTLTKIS